MLGGCQGPDRLVHVTKGQVMVILPVADRVDGTRLLIAEDDHPICRSRLQVV